MKLDNLLFVMAGVLSLAFFLAFVLLSVEYTADKEPRCLTYPEALPFARGC
jgi:hypothetical protein